MLKNDYLVVKIGVDTAENEPRKECVLSDDEFSRAKQRVHRWVLVGVVSGHGAFRASTDRVALRAEGGPHVNIFINAPQVPALLHARRHCRR